MESGPVAEWRLFRVGDGCLIADRLRVADGLWSRFWGWMGRRAIEPGEGLLLAPARSIHTSFMRVAIDAAFVDRTGRVLRVTRGVRPWRIAWAPRGTWAVVELPAEAAAPLAPGDVLALAPQAGREAARPRGALAAWTSRVGTSA